MDYLAALYIDPGTGGMLFTILFGIFGVAVFSIRALMLKLKYRVSGDKSAKINDQKLPIVIILCKVEFSFIVLTLGKTAESWNKTQGFSICLESICSPTGISMFLPSVQLFPTSIKCGSSSL